MFVSKELPDFFVLLMLLNPSLLISVLGRVVRLNSAGRCKERGHGSAKQCPSGSARCSIAVHVIRNLGTSLIVKPGLCFLLFFAEGLF